jgi:MFS family permease
VFLAQSRFITDLRQKAEPVQSDSGQPVPMAAALGGVPASVWMVTLCIGIIGCCVAMALPLAHVVSHVTDIGFSAARAAEMLAVMLLVSGVTRLTLMGYVSDRIGSLPALLFFSVIQTVTVGLFVLVDHLAILYLISIVFGIGYGGILPLYPVVLREHLSGDGIGRRTAIVIFFGGIGMALGGWAGGFLFDQTGGYLIAFMAGVGANVVNLIIIGILLLRLRRVRLSLI